MASNDTQTPAKPRTAVAGARKDSDTHGLAEIRAEISALAEQVRSLVADGRKDGSTGFRRLRKRASGSIADMAEAGGQVVHSMGNELASAQRQTIGAVRRHPAWSVAVVLGFGLLFVVLARR